MEKKTPEQILNKAITGDYNNGSWSVRECHLGQAEAINAMQDYAKQETERLQAENKAMREKLQEVHKYLGSHDCTEATELRFMQEISTLLNQ